jgi:hypothetical protein
MFRSGVEVRGGYIAAGEDISETERKSRFGMYGTTSANYQAVLSGDIGTINDESDNAYHVIIGLDIPNDGKTILDGFTITGGNSDEYSELVVNGKYIRRDHGGGIYNGFDTAPVLTNVAITGNTASNDTGFRVVCSAE